MEKKAFNFLLVLMLMISFITFGTNFAKAENDKLLIITLTVEGEIQTDDPWTTGGYSTNEWAKPMYYIWFDPNGDFTDARYGNGAGSNAHQIRLDTGRLYLEVLNGESIGPIYETSTSSKEWSDIQNNIKASITNSDKSLEIIIPLSLINDPSTLEVSAMCSPHTSSAVDNTGAGSGSSNGWVIISDTSLDKSYEFIDVTGESVNWPSSLSNSDRLPNFNIEKLEIVVGEGSDDTTTENTDDTDMDKDEKETEKTPGFEIILVIFALSITLTYLKKKKIS